MKMIMLLVDDEPIILNGLKNAIDWRAMGIDHILLAYDGERALAISKQQDIQIIITDIMMPQMDGLEYIRCLREFNKTAKIIILSGYDRFEYAQQAMRLGASEYLLKPLSNQELENAVQRVLKMDVPSKVLAQENRSFESVVRSVYYGQGANAHEESMISSAFYVCMIKFTQPGSMNIRSAIAKDALSLKEVCLFDADDRRALLFCPLKEDENYAVAAENLYKMICGLHGMDDCAFSMLVGLPGKDARDLYQSRMQLENLEKLRVQQHGIEYVQDNENLLKLRPEIRKAVEYIRYNYSSPLSLNEVADYVHISSNYLSGTFKAEFGENYSSFLARTRIEQAAQLFLRGHKYVYEVAATVGYKDVVYFSKLFKKYMSCTPQEFIRRNKL